jgi:predicted component of type VI protein secretion system
MIVRFHVVAPAAKQRTFSVRLPILLGRGEEAKFRIQHDLVSRRHCEFFEREGRVYVRDLGSTNGTFLNDEQVPASTKTVVPQGGMVRVGGLSFRVEYDLSEAVDAAAVGEGHDRRNVAGEDASGGDESRVEGKGEASSEEQPDFQVVHEDDEPAAVQADVALPEQAVADAAGSADAAADRAVPEQVRPPEAAAEQTAEPVSPSQQPEGFDFLSGAAATTASADLPQWPAADDAVADASDDDELNSFFKGLK